ncbi:MAG: hypothetical protein R3F53_23055 [Gammaproteobacteria bacterium]
MHEVILKKIGPDDYQKLLNGELSYKDPRVIEAFQYVRDLVDAALTQKVFPPSNSANHTIISTPSLAV